MTATRTWLPPLPASYVAAWRRSYLQRCSATSPLLGASGGVLEPLQADGAVDQRVLRFGHVWRWWGLSAESKTYWRALG